MTQPNSTHPYAVRLGWFKREDERNAQYPVRALLEATPATTKMWDTQIWLDQGQTPECVGFSWTQWAASNPTGWPGLTAADADSLYHEAQRDDETAGENYEGSSTLGGVRASQAEGRVSSYHWANTVDDIAAAVSQVGPMVIGINWYNNMFDPDPTTGLLNVGGGLAGGHEILINGVDVEKKLFRFHNSWGQSWGINGEAYISYADLNRLVFTENGDACLPIKLAPATPTPQPVPVPTPTPTPVPVPQPVPTPTPKPVPTPKPKPKKKHKHSWPWWWFFGATAE